METKQRATVTRPTVARALQEAGHEITPIRSIWGEDRVEWAYELNSESAHLILHEYEKIGKKPPLAVRTFLEQEAQE